MLRPGENLLWSGKPDKRRFLLRGWWAIPFSLMWGGFALFWEGSVISTNAPFFFRLWGVPFVVIGLYLIVGRFFVAAREADNTWYAVTNRRILIHGGLLRQNFTELDLARLPALQLSSVQGGIGSIIFGASSSFGSGFVIPGWPMNGSQTSPAFQAIPDAREVYEIIKQAQGSQ